MTFDKCTINGRVYGELLDDEGNSVDITGVSITTTNIYRPCAAILMTIF